MVYGCKAKTKVKPNEGVGKLLGVGEAAVLNMVVRVSLIETT